ncbi:MAG TPA: hypothetical protein VHU41_01115, partial [Thermoanaerobaculia bacterium]|nr:hypothetical protein [Thermoanaerobaculia bacterium]
AWAEALFLLAAIGQLTPIPIAALAGLSVVGCLLSVQKGQPTTDNRQLFLVALFLPLILLASHPPLAFDETLYHLPTVRSLATFGKLRVATELRFAVFPQLHELLCVPLYLLAGDTATHLVSVAEVLITAALLLEWGGWLATAFFLGSPIVVYLATVGYVDAALTLFVAAAFYCIDRDKHAHAGFFLGVACGVKYLGGYFALAALLYLLLRNRRAAPMFALACAAAALPTMLWIVIRTGNPIFPFFDSRVPAPRLFHFTLPWRVLWDVTFARGRVGLEPPMTPLLIPAVIVLIIAAVRERRARAVAALSAGYLLLFAFLPQDTRYLVPLLPLIAIVVAGFIPSKRWLVWIAILPGILYAGYRFHVNGLPPATPAERDAYLAKHVPEYRAVKRAGTGTIYVCGGEQLKYYADGRLLGDFFGPWTYKYVLDHLSDTASIAGNLRQIGAEYYLVSKRVCTPPRATGGMDLVYEDAGAQLWRVQPSQPSR